jgi:hypothetical protein
MNCYVDMKSTYSTLGEVLIPMGVRQGDPLFILFINMFLKAMETTAKPYMRSHSPNKLAAFLLPYADDITFYAENRDNLKLLVDKFDKFTSTLPMITQKASPWQYKALKYHI